MTLLSVELNVFGLLCLILFNLVPVFMRIHLEVNSAGLLKYEFIKPLLDLVFGDLSQSLDLFLAFVKVNYAAVICDRDPSSADFVT
jgi:hypothetical protein